MKNTTELRILMLGTCRKVGVKAVFKSQKTLHQILTGVKKARPAMRNKDVII